MRERVMNRIAALIDFTEVTQRVLDFSAEQARANNAELYLLHVEPKNGPTLYREIDDAERNRIANILRYEHDDLLAKVAELREHLDIKVHPVLMEGTEVEEAILAEVTKLKVDHVVLGNHHHSRLHNYFLGSVGHKLMKNLGCPMTLISDKDASG
jgi:nucleotide-binding universal stress UspA family protein